eukprot:370157_1
MFSKALRRVRLYRLCRPSLSKRFQTTMYCMQCEQTSHGTGCTAQGICGKWPETAAMQDLLLYANNGLSQYLYKMDEKILDSDLREEARSHIMESTFSTLTNVNFSEDRMIDYIHKTIGIRELIKPKFRDIYPEKQDFEIIENNPSNYFVKNSENMHNDAIELASLHAIKSNIGDSNCFGLRECASYGLKGMMAYYHHAESMQEKK